MKALFPGHLTFKERINRMIMLLVFASSVIGIVLVLPGADLSVLYSLVPICAISGLSIRMTLTQGDSKKASWLLAIGTNVVFFPMLFINSGGTESGMPVWFVLGLVYIFLLFEGRDFWIAITLSLLAFLGTYLFAYYRPELVPESTRFYSFSDSFFALICVSLFIGILLKIQSRTYEQEKQIAEEQKREVEQIARSKDTFFANMSHEIRTPINTIIGLNEMILREDISDEIAENAINIQNASKMLLTTINDILDLSKLESGKMDIVPTQYAISSMFSDLVNLIWIRAHQKNLEFKVDIDPDIPSMLYGDEVRIKQVVTNMLTNAVKYTESGSVTLSAKGERVAADQILLRISVEDTGMGIRKESLDDLFRSFKRVDESDNRNIEGTGLGLNISKQLIEMMGGKITVDSVYHKGSVFTIELKQRIVNVRPIGVINFAAQKQLNQRSVYRQSFIAPDARILVVDDNSMNLMVVVKLLRDTKVKVDTAESGKEALKQTAENTYHVILMDHMMPEMDGVETTRVIRRLLGDNGQVPIIALTANAVEGTAEMFISEGMNDFVTKPIEMRDMVSKLRRWLPSEKIEKRKKKNKGGASVLNMRKDDGDVQASTDIVIEGLDVQKAMGFLGNEELFWSVLKEYYRVIDKKCALIQEYEQSEKWKEYTVEVHALKSASRQIGALELAYTAEQMEAAGNAGNAALIHKITPGMLEEYMFYKGILSPYFVKEEETDSGRAAKTEEMAALFGQMEEAMENLDMDAMEQVVKDMSQYSYSDAQRDIFEKLRNAVEDIDTERCAEIIAEWKKELEG